MIENTFWKKWRNKTFLEKRAISAIHRAVDFLFANIPKKEIISVYIKGSFVTREINKKSDVDIVPILKNNYTLRKLKTIRDKNKEMLKPAELLPITITELEKNKNSRLHGKLKGRPDTFLRDLEHYKLIYGKRVSKSDYPMRGINNMFQSEIISLRDKTIPLYLEGKFGFSQLIKQVFWISYFEQKISGKHPPRTWKGLSNFVKDKRHIIHKVYYLRMHPTKNKKIRAQFITYLKRYINTLNIVRAVPPNSSPA